MGTGRFGISFYLMNESITVCKETAPARVLDHIFTFRTLDIRFFFIPSTFNQSKYIQADDCLSSYFSSKKYPRSLKTGGNEKSMINGPRSSNLCTLLL